MQSQIRSDPSLTESQINNNHSDLSDLSDLLNLWNVVRRYLPNILLFIFSSVIITWLVVSKINPVYRATALISIEKESVPFTTDGSFSTTGATTKEYRSTQVEILRSRSLIEDVVKTLDLSSHKAFNSRQPGWQQLLTYWSDKYLGNTEATVYEEQSAVDDEDVVNSVAKALKVNAIVNTNVISVDFNSQDANLTARVANALSLIHI